MSGEHDAFQERVGQLIDDQWRLEQLLGTGGMGAVYRARGTDGQLVALKILHPEHNRRPEVRERFVREGDVANHIDHAGAVRVIDRSGADRDEAYLVMELLDGVSLGERARSDPKLTPEQLFHVLDQVLDVLALAHAKNYVHRDLKPENLFITSDGTVKVLDFGLARSLDDVPGAFQTRTGLALGTLAYMAPEQALGRRHELDGRTDLFALGATAYRILAGRKLHEAPSEAELLMAMASKPAAPLSECAPHVPLHFCQVIDLAVAFAREARYPDARTMQDDIRAVLAGEAPPFASTRLRARADATRVDRPAAVVPPAAADPIAARAEPARSKSGARPGSRRDASPESVRRIERTVPLAATLPPDSGVRVPSALLGPPPGPASTAHPSLEAASPNSSTTPASTASGTPLASRARAGAALGILLAVVLLFVTTAGGALAYFYWSERGHTTDEGAHATGVPTTGNTTESAVSSVERPDGVPGAQTATSDIKARAFSTGSANRGESPIEARAPQASSESAPPKTKAKKGAALDDDQNERRATSGGEPSESGASADAPQPTASHPAGAVPPGPAPLVDEPDQDDDEPKAKGRKKSKGRRR